MAAPIAALRAKLGPVKFLRQERRRGQTRVTFKCGQRAYADYAAKHRLMIEAAALFSTEIGQVPELVARNLTQLKEMQRSLDALTQAQLTRKAEELLQTAESIGAYRLVTYDAAATTVDGVKILANWLQSQEQTLALLGCASSGKATLLFVRSADAPLHMGNLLRVSLAEFGGGGGGRPDFAQGGGVAPEKIPALLEFAANKVREELMDKPCKSGTYLLD